MHKFGIINLFHFSYSHLYLVMTFTHTFLNCLPNITINSFFTYKKPSSNNSLICTPFTGQPVKGVFS